MEMCFWLSCGLPPSMRVRDLRARNRGDLSLGPFNVECLDCSMVSSSLMLLRKNKIKDARERYLARLGLDRMVEVKADFSNLAACRPIFIMHKGILPSFILAPIFCCPCNCFFLLLQLHLNIIQEEIADKYRWQDVFLGKTLSQARL